MHPPLGKLLFAAVSYLAGWPGVFEFDALGRDYLEPHSDVPYVALRLFSAVLGAAMVPTAYGAAMALSGRKKASKQ